MFQNRREAGRLLGQKLLRFKDEHPVILGVPRGGVEVAFEVAKALEAPLDIMVARKLGAPDQPELAIGAVVDGDHPMAILNQDVIQAYGISQRYLESVVERELTEIDRRQRAYRQEMQPAPLEGETVILVDDGIATGASIKAALRGLHRKGVGRLILAVPVAPAETIQDLQSEVDEIVCLSVPKPFIAVGAHYEDFGQTSDETVVDLLNSARAWTNGRRQAIESATAPTR